MKIRICLFILLTGVTSFCLGQQKPTFNSHNKALIASIKSEILKNSEKGIITILTAKEESIKLLYFKNEGLAMYLEKGKIKDSRYDILLADLSKIYKVENPNITISDTGVKIIGQFVTAKSLKDLEALLWSVFSGSLNDKQQPNFTLSYQSAH